MRVVGMISGTSMDGIDVAVADLRFVGDTVELRPLGATTSRLRGGAPRRPRRRLPPAPTTAEEVCRLDTFVGQAFAEAARAAVDEFGGGDGRPDRVARPDDLPLGRRRRPGPRQSADRPAGLDRRGHRCSRSSPTCGRATSPPAGTVRRSPARSTNCCSPGRARSPRHSTSAGSPTSRSSPAARRRIAFDIGPANALIDAAVWRGERRGRGVRPRRRPRPAGVASHAGLLERLLAEPYYRQPPPKSTGKELFHVAYLLDHVAAVGTRRSRRRRRHGRPPSRRSPSPTPAASSASAARRVRRRRRQPGADGTARCRAARRRDHADRRATGSRPRPRRPTCSPSSASSPCTSFPAASPSATGAGRPGRARLCAARPRTASRPSMPANVAADPARRRCT